ncbi:MAG: sensor histidine kinase, partial [Vicinamibacteria bacterium]
MFVLDATIAPHNLALSAGTLAGMMLLDIALLTGRVLDRIARRPVAFAYFFEMVHAIGFSVLMICLGIEEMLAFFGFCIILLVVHSRMISPDVSLTRVALVLFGIFLSTIGLHAAGLLPTLKAFDMSETSDLLAVGALTASIAAIDVYFVMMADLARRKSDETARAVAGELDVVERDRARIAALHAEARDLAVRLEARERDLKDFAQITTHDLTNVALGTRLMADRLMTELEGKVDESSASALRAVVEDTKHFMEMLHALQALFVKSEEAEDRREVDCGALVSRVLEALRVPVREKGVRVEVGELPRVEIEEQKLYHVMWNLIGNAVKYVGDKPDPTIWVTSEEGERELRLRVSDNGIGVSEREQRMIFKPFRRGTRQVVGEKRVEGTGIGLALVQR